MDIDRGVQETRLSMRKASQEMRQALRRDFCFRASVAEPEHAWRFRRLVELIDEVEFEVFEKAKGWRVARETAALMDRLRARSAAG
jgi:hypothetical protein